MVRIYYVFTEDAVSCEFYLFYRVAVLVHTYACIGTPVLYE